MVKLNKKLSVMTLAIALMSTVAFATPEKVIEGSENFYTPSWKQQFLNAPIAEKELSNSIVSGKLIYSDDSDSDEEDVKTRVAQQKAAKYAAETEKASGSTSGFWGKVQTVLAPITSWVKKVISSFVFVR